MRANKWEATAHDTAKAHHTQREIKRERERENYLKKNWYLLAVNKIFGMVFFLRIALEKENYLSTYTMIQSSIFVVACFQKS